MKSLICAITLAAGVAMAAPVSAGTYVQFSGSTATFGDTQVQPVGFADVIDLGDFGGYISAGQAYKMSGTISTSYQSGAQSVQDINFSTVSLNGKNFTLSPDGQFEFGFVADVASAASNLLRINGSSGSNASYAGTLTIAAVPEAATWAMMIFGFGAVGSMARRRVRADRKSTFGWTPNKEYSL
jgi:hypothetical protein